MSNPIPKSWPVDTSAVVENRWNLDAAAFLALVQRFPMMWTMDWGLKYLDIRVDTRDGGFLLFTRDKELISPDRVLNAIHKANAMFPKEESDVITK